ncbi:terminase small subunit [Actinomadura flavalba]|uniref:terminase small subunit n=1 Tax=Actinomadura flavalba TaxID=1120938 RepID=UPI000373BCDB|nr:hypothetical protein [Actinomadura flavalba]
MGRRLTPAPEPEPRPPDLRDAVAEALEEMPWLRPSDRAVAALALRQATEIERAADRAAELAALRREFAGEQHAMQRLKALEAECEVAKLVGWLGPQLQLTLRDLGGTPGARRKIQPEKKAEGRLAQLRAAAGQHDA